MFVAVVVREKGISEFEVQDRHGLGLDNGVLLVHGVVSGDRRTTLVKEWLSAWIEKRD